MATVGQEPPTGSDPMSRLAQGRFRPVPSSGLLALTMGVLAALFGACADPGQRDFPDRWIDGTQSDEPLYQIHEHAPGTWIIRQSLTVDFEAPFLYLLKGEKKALLLDTGATDEPWIRAVVDGLIGEDHPLIVAHSHAHRDHVAGRDGHGRSG